MHGDGLQPDEEGWFFVEGLEVDLYNMVIVREQHFAGAFGKVDLVPIKQVNIAEKGNKKQGPYYHKE